VQQSPLEKMHPVLMRSRLSEVEQRDYSPIGIQKKRSLKIFSVLKF